jgi:hypothetical protein
MPTKSPDQYVFPNQELYTSQINAAIEVLFRSTPALTYTRDQIRDALVRQFDWLQVSLEDYLAIVRHHCVSDRDLLRLNGQI